MKSILAVLFAATLTPAAFAQESRLPEVLMPDRDIAASAERTGIEVFKLLPRGMFKSNSARDEDSPIGIRGEGAFYSFSTRLHSYNKIPQISYEGGTVAVGGFYGANYGFIRDLGPGSLADINSEFGVPKFLLEYQPPTLLNEVRREQRKSHKYETAESGAFATRVPAAIGHIYVLRSINFDEADILVAFQVQQMDKDGSLTIGWKRIKEFAVPRLERQTDEALQAKVNAVLAEPRYQHVTAIVKGEVATLTGSIKADDLDGLMTAINENAGPRSVVRKSLKVNKR